MSHLDDAQLDAYMAGRAEFADLATRREAGRHIADCAECSRRLKHAWSGHPESIDHPVGPPGRPSWPLLRVSGPVARPSVPPQADGTATAAPGRTSARPRPPRPERPGRSSAPAAAVAPSADDPLSGTPWPALIAALEAVLRPSAAEPATRRSRAAPRVPWAADDLPPEVVAAEEPELVDHSGDMPALDLDLVDRYQARAEHSRRRARRRQVLAAAAMIAVAVLLAGAVLKVGALSTSAWRQAPPPATVVTPAAPLLESAAALQAFAESVRTGTDSLDAVVASVLHPDVRAALVDPGEGQSTAPADTAPRPVDRSGGAREAAPATPAPEPSPPSRLAPTRRAATPDTALTSGEWQETTAAAAERVLGHRLLLIAGLGLESIARPTSSTGPFVRIAQVTRSGDRVAVVLSRSAPSPGAPAAPPGLGVVRILPAADGQGTAMAMGRWGDVMVTVRADLPPDTLRAFMARLREGRN